RDVRWFLGRWFVQRRLLRRLVGRGELRRRLVGRIGAWLVGGAGPRPTRGIDAWVVGRLRADRFGALVGRVRRRAGRSRGLRFVVLVTAVAVMVDLVPPPLRLAGAAVVVVHDARGLLLDVELEVVGADRAFVADPDELSRRVGFRRSYLGHGGERSDHHHGYEGSEGPLRDTAGGVDPPLPGIASYPTLGHASAQGFTPVWRPVHY